MVYEMNEILFWNDISDYLDFTDDLETKLNPDKIVEDRRKWADEMAAFILREIPTKQDFLDRIAEYERNGKPVPIADRNPCCNDLSIEKLKKAYKNAWFRGKERADIVEQWAMEYIGFYVEHIFKQTQEDILEMTVGAGGGTVLVVKNMRENDFYTGVDIDFKCAKNADGILKHYGKPGVGIATSLWNLPFEDDTFSVICSHFGLDECREVPTILKEVARVLKPNGRIVFACHNAKYRRLKKCFDLYGFTEAEAAECIKRVRLYADHAQLSAEMHRLGFTKSAYRQFDNRYYVVEYTKT